MTRRLTNPRPPGDRGQGRKREYVPRLRYGQQVAVSGVTATVTHLPETYYVLTFADGTQIELKPAK